MALLDKLYILGGSLSSCFAIPRLLGAVVLSIRAVMTLHLCLEVVVEPSLLLRDVALFIDDRLDAIVLLAFPLAPALTGTLAYSGGS